MPPGPRCPRTGGWRRVPRCEPSPGASARGSSSCHHLHRHPDLLPDLVGRTDGTDARGIGLGRGGNDPPAGGDLIHDGVGSHAGDVALLEPLLDGGYPRGGDVAVDHLEAPQILTLPASAIRLIAILRPVVRRNNCPILAKSSTSKTGSIHTSSSSQASMALSMFPSCSINDAVRAPT